MCNRITSVTNSFYSLSSYADAAFKTPYLPKNKKKKITDKAIPNLCPQCSNIY